MTGINRIENVLQWMKGKALDALLVACPYNVRYISRFSGDTAYLYLSEKRQVLLTDARYTTWAKTESVGFDVFEIHREKSYADQIAEYLKEENAQTIGFENRKMLYCDVMNFKMAFQQTEMIEVDLELDNMRMIKTSAEIEKIRQAEHIGDLAFTHILNYIKEGMTEQQIAFELEAEMKRQGAEKLSFETIVASGSNSAMPHATPGKKEIEKGDFVTMDFGCVYEGYCSDMTRTIVMGQADERQKEIYNIVLEAQLRALDVVKAGVKGCEVDKAARDVIEKAGYGSFFGHGLGHSLGLFIHENPRFAPKDDTIMKANMLETVEPGIYIPDFGGVRIEDLIVIKEDGYVNLTHSPKELIQL